MIRRYEYGRELLAFERKLPALSSVADVGFKVLGFRVASSPCQPLAKQGAVCQLVHPGHTSVWKFACWTHYQPNLEAIGNHNTLNQKPEEPRISGLRVAHGVRA